MSQPVQVLYVDDDSALGDLTRTFLERADEKLIVEHVDSAAVALERLDNDAFDCIVSDYQMPEKNGLELLSSIREMGTDLPFILFTGQGSEEIASEAISAGVTDYLQKESGTDQFTVLANRIIRSVESHRRAAKLQEREEWFRAVLSGSKDIVTILDETGTITYESPAVESTLGWGPEELIGENAFDYVHPDDQDRTLAKFARALEDPSYAPTIELRFRDGAGEWRHVEVTGKNHLDDPLIEGIIINTRDIAARKRREARLDQQTERLQSIVENIPVVLFVLDENGVFTFSEGRGLATLGYDPGENVGHSVFDVYEDHEQVTDACRRALAGESFNEEVSVGEQVFETWYRPVQTVGGDIDRVIGVSIDVTDRHRREQQLERFASVVSHDLRSPLTVAMGALDLALETSDPAYFERVSRAHDRIETLIETLLSLTHQGQAVTDASVVSLGTFVETAWQNVDTDAGTLESCEDAYLRADPDRLLQLLENLFRNAVEHGAQQTLDDSTDESSRREAVTVQVGRLVDGFFVADDGPGITPVDRDSVFEYGYTTNDEGTGFGLGIVRSVAEAHGWSVAVTESERGGAQFEITGVTFVEHEEQRS